MDFNTCFTSKSFWLDNIKVVVTGRSVDGDLSDYVMMKYSVPQGSVLGP